MPANIQIDTNHSREIPALGPSDSSDSGADLVGAGGADPATGDLTLDTTDRYGTGERMTADAEDVQEAADIGVDRVVDAADAGLGGGLDQAEEAQLGITDEELEKLIGDS